MNTDASLPLAIDATEAATPVRTAPPVVRPVLDLPLPMHSHAEFAVKIDRALADCRRQRSRLVVLLVQVEAIGLIDDTGHIHAEATPKVEASVLDKFALRLRRRLRTTDHMVRLDGRHIGVVLVGAGADEASVVGRRMLAALTEPYRLEAHLLSLRLGIGQAIYPERGVSGRELLRVAEQGLARPAKPTGEGG